MKKIKSIEIKNSLFFEDNFKISFDDKLNCIMGGRGTGKTTLLYFILSSLKSDIESSNKTAFNILKSNLGQGEIVMEIENDNGIVYKISKYLNDEPQPSKLPTGEFIAIDRIVNEIECDIYEASAIEEIGRNSEERLKLINKMIPDSINELMLDINKKKIDLNENAQTLKIIKQKLLQKQDALSILSNTKDELAAWRKSIPKDIDSKEDDEFNIADKNEKTRSSELRFIVKSRDLHKTLMQNISNLKDEISTYKSNNDLEGKSFLNQEIMQRLVKGISDHLNLIYQGIELAETELTFMKKCIEENNTELITLHEKQQSDFIKLKQKIQFHREYYTKLNELTKKENDRIELEKDYNEEYDKIAKLKTNRQSLISELNKKKDEIFNIRLKKVAELNEDFKGKIKIGLKFGGITDEYETYLKESLRGSGLRYNELVPRIVQHFSPDRFAKVINDKDVESLKTIAGIDEVRSNTLINKLFETDEIYIIEAMYCPDLPDFYLRIEKNSTIEIENYQKSDYLSTGQRCTAVLPIIFAVSNNPLIIDQPEDNLDNKYITKTIYAIIKDQKENRQLIFITHNPNIPVLSEAENNIFLKYDKISMVDKLGTVEEVKNHILDLLEGGEQAFETRRHLYENDIV